MEPPWREVVEKTHLGVWIIDEQDRTLYVNERLATLLGFSSVELLGRTPPEFLEPRQGLHFMTRLKQSLPLLTDICCRRRDGGYLYLLIAASHLYTPTTPSQGILMMVADITERKLVEELLWRQAHIVDQIHDAVISVDLDGFITSWNQGAERLFGYLAFEAQGKPLSLLYSPEQQEILTKQVMTLLQEKGLYDLELQLRRHSGDLFYAHLSLSPLKDREGNIMGVIAAARDITERKIMENEMIRTSKLETVSVLAGGIAHDFNNLLTAILGNIAMASLNASSTAFVQERLAEAEKACLRAQNLTRQLLSFSKNEKPHKRLTAISELLKTSTSLVLRSSNVRRHADIPPDLWWVEVDEEQINQAINNLLINADQAMPLGGDIYLKAENVDITDTSLLPLKPGLYVKVAITDQGIGIPPDQLSKVFDPFFTTKRRGSGLGLSTVYTIIKNHEGYITVESSPRGGATFVIYLPAIPKKGPLPKAKKVKLDFGQGKILLMDDEEMILGVSSAMLRRLGYEVVVAQDGALAIDYYRQAMAEGEPFDAVILDLTVPGGLGAKETIGDLLQLDPQARVIVSSGFSDDPLRNNFHYYGFSGFMPKPYNLTQLSAMMYNVVKSR
ncbi:MAG: PAS domain S-box protein [Deltaproteobacteria bacterium]|nr:PAS domain S-box protein [Deltaproteobacteria bacterium]